MVAPHVFVEDISVESIAAIGKNYGTADLRERLARYHGKNVDVAFWGWNRVWLDPGFRDWSIVHLLEGIDVPVQVIQGKDDGYGTLAQVAAIEEGVSVPFRKRLLDQCGHSPHRDQPQPVIDEMAQFVSSYSAGLAAPSS